LDGEVREEYPMDFGVVDTIHIKEAEGLIQTSREEQTTILVESHCLHHSLQFINPNNMHGGQGVVYQSLSRSMVWWLKAMIMMMMMMMMLVIWWLIAMMVMKKIMMME